MKSFLIRLILLIFISQFSYATTTLTSGVSQSSSVSNGYWRYYKITANSGATVTVDMTGLSSDIDLYVKKGSQPTLSSYDARPYYGGTTSESATVTIDSSTTVYIGVYGYTSSGFNIKATVSGGSSGDDGSDSGTTTTITGKITYDKIHANSNAIGLDYNNITQEPAKQIVVKAIDSSNNIIASTTTNDNGEYSLDNLPQDTQVKIRVYAQMKKIGTSGWDIKVIDNTNENAQYVMEGNFATTGTANTQRNINASSGWNGNSYSNPRTAAPFAILGSIYVAIQKVITADSSVSFPSLSINWSKNNISSSGNKADGQIGTSHYTNSNLYILGDENSDTDEYDNHVIIHEWGHYFEDNFSRSDSIGGSHGDGDILDIRVAFGEGWGNAWSAIATDDPIYFDTIGSHQSNGFFMNIENETRNTPGWFSEASIQRILYDIYDSHNDGDDTLSLGFEPIYNVMIGAEKTTPAFTSIFTFITALQNANPSISSKIDTILSSEDITHIDDIYGSSQKNDLYTNIQVGNTLNICTSGEYGRGNKLDNHKFIRFTINNSGNYNVNVQQTNGNNSDPNFSVYKTSPFATVGSSRGDTVGSESKSFQLSTGNYLLDISEYNGLQTACFDIKVD